MLVLSRNVNESVVIGDDIILTIIKTLGSRVEIGINAPTEIPILRGELKGKNFPPKKNKGKGSLALTRREEETILIGHDVEVMVVRISGNVVRLGITAPKAIPVHRQEVYDAIKRRASN